MYSTLLDWEFPADRVMLCFSLLVKCLKNTPAFFAERLNKAMRVCNMHVEDLGQGVSAPPVPGTTGSGSKAWGDTPQQRGQRAHGQEGSRLSGEAGW